MIQVSRGAQAILRPIVASSLRPSSVPAHSRCCTSDWFRSRSSADKASACNKPGFRGGAFRFARRFAAGTPRPRWLRALPDFLEIPAIIDSSPGRDLALPYSGTCKFLNFFVRNAAKHLAEGCCGLFCGSIQLRPGAASKIRGKPIEVRSNLSTLFGELLFKLEAKNPVNSADFAASPFPAAPTACSASTCSRVRASCCNHSEAWLIASDAASEA